MSEIAKNDTNETSTMMTPESSPQDDRGYAIYTTSSGLMCLLVSDPDTDKAAAAMDVRVGHFSDPEEIPGLAHFLEHMLFMGTEKYPDENDYNEFLNNHGGSSNAFTDMESTNYYFDVGSNHLEGALDRFAQFFISPLFTDSATQRELQAVESEHAKNLQNDYWRQFQLYKDLAKPDHPFHKFGSGNLKTLKTVPDEKSLDVRKFLLDFHAAHYSSNISKLVVLGKQSLDELRILVEKCFASMENKMLQRNVFDSEPYSSNELCQRISVVPVSDSMRIIELSFPMREVNTLYMAKPTRYISHLLGHEGKGSVLALLKDLGWANELSAGESRGCTDWASFTVSIEVTDEGLVHANDVVEIVFAYINLIREAGPQRWIHDETATVADCQFRFLNKRPPMDYTCSLASAMQIYPPEHVLSGPYRIYEYKPDEIVDCLSYLKPSNVLIMIMDKTLEGKTTLNEEWYGTPYCLEKMEASLLDQWAQASVNSDLVGGPDKLHLPEKNDLIASDFTLREDMGAPIDEPRLQMDTDLCRLWYKPDNVFKMPKLNVIALLKCDLPEQSVKNNVLCLLWVQLLQELCTEFTYNASMASLHSSFQNSRLGVEIHVSGYNHKMNVLLQKIVDEMKELPSKMTTELFERIQDKVMKQYQQFMFSQPYQHMIYAVDLALETAKFHIEEKIRVLKEEITLPDVIEFTKSLLGSHKLEMLVHGNATPEEAEALANTLLTGLKQEAPTNLPVRRVVHLESMREYVLRLKEFNVDDTNSALGAVYQVGVTDIETNATLSLLHHLVREPTFNELRTQEQLGYIVFSTVKTSGNDVKALMFLIQSDSHDPIHCDGRVEAFLDRFRNKLAEMPDEEFNANKNAVVELLLEKNKNLGEESGKYWDAIANESYKFRKFQMIADVVKCKLTKDIVLGFFNDYIAKDAPNRKKLSVQVFSKQHESRMEDAVASPDTTTVIDFQGVSEFQRSMELYPATPAADMSPFMG